MYSRPIKEIVQEVERLSQNGFREIVLTGIHLGHYGVDFNKGKPKSEWTRLSGLVEKLIQIEGDFRVRLSSIEATEVTRELIRVMQEHEDRVCPHLHVCLQSGSDRILRRMKRRWSRKHIIDRCSLVKNELDYPAFSTDVIVGFPGETEDDFEDTLDACRQIGFSKIHMFPFSARKSTPAAEFSNQIPKAVKAERGRAVKNLESDLRAEYFERLTGRTLKLLVEKIDEDSGTVSGTTCRYAPTTATVPSLDSSLAELDGKIVDVVVDSYNEKNMVGVAVS